MRGPVAALLALGLVGGLARADTPVRLRYQASPGCPDQQAFVALVRGRVARLQLVDQGAPQYDVSVEQTERGASGRLALASGGQGVLVREVSAERCDEVVEALALVLAMSLQPPTPAASTPAAASEAPAASGPPASQPPQPPPPPPAERWSSGAQGVVRTGVAPEAMGGGALFVERAWAKNSTFSPVVRAWVGATVSRSIDVEPGTVRVRLVTARLDACPLSLLARPTLALWPCVGLEGGVIGARGGGVARPGSAVDVWAAAQGLGRLRWSPSPRWSLEAEAGLAVALTRHTFVFERPEREVARPSLLGGSFAAGVALSIP